MLRAGLPPNMGQLGGGFSLAGAAEVGVATLGVRGGPQRISSTVKMATVMVPVNQRLSEPECILASFACSKR